MIKKYFYLVMVALVATLPFSLASCVSDDDDHDGGINSDIVGTWKDFSASGWGVDDEEGEVYAQFKKDGTYVEASYYEDDDGYTVSTGTWYQKGDYIYITISADLGILDDDDTDDDMTFPFRVVSVDRKTMSLEFLGYIITAVKVADSEMQEFMKKHEGDRATDEIKQYSFKFNGKPYYYGCDYYWAGMKDLKETAINNHFSMFEDDVYDGYFNSVMLSINAQNVPLEIYWETEEVQAVDKTLDGTFKLKWFDPKTAKKGDVLEFYQSVKSMRTDSNDPKYLYDFNNYIYYSEYSGKNLTTHSYADGEKTYTWRDKAKGKVIFDSYKEDEMGKKQLTLIFENVTMEVYQGSDYSDCIDKSQQAVINGKIIFTSGII